MYLVALHTVFTMTDGYRRRFAAAGLAVSWILVADFIPFAGFLAHTPFAFVQAYCFFGALLLLVFFLTTGEAIPDQPVGRPR
jgi:hypothetical protein